MNFKKSIYNWWWQSGNGTGPFFSQFIEAQKISNTQINIYWEDTGADTYIVDYSTDNATWTNLYNGNNSTLNYNHTGLIVNTLYYYRVKGKKTGYVDSAYSTAQSSTLTFAPLFMYDYRGLVQATDNLYGTTGTPTGGNINVLKSFLGSGPNITSVGTTNTAINQQSPRNAYVTGQHIDAQYFKAPSDITISGDFTIMMRAYHVVVPVFYRVLNSESNDNYLISLSNSTTVAFAVNGSTVTRTWPITLTTETPFDMVFQRTGSNFRIGQHDRIAGTISWSATVACSSADFIFRRFFGSSTGANCLNANVSFIGCVNSSISDSQVDEFFSIGFSPSFSIPSDFVSGTIPGLTFSALSSGYFSNNVANIGLDSNSWRKLVSIGDKSFMNVTLPKGGTTYGQDIVHVYDHAQSKASTITLANYNTSADVHETGSLFNAGNRLGRVRQSPFYTSTTNSELKVSMCAANMNFNSFGTKTDLTGIAKISFALQGYLSVVKQGNKLVMLSQEFTGSFARWIILSVSYDYGRSWKEKVRVADSGASPDWWYPFLLDAGDNSTIYIVFMNFNTTKYRFCCMAKTTDFYNWSNMANSYSQDVRGNNPITLTQGKTNYLVGNDATALAGGSRVLDTHIDASGNAYILMTNGSETGHIFITITSGGSVTTNNLSYGGKTVELNHFFDGTVWKTASNTYNVALFEVVGGNHFVDLFRTTDGGSTWSYIQRVTTDNVNNHRSIVIPRNIDNINYSIIGTVRDVDATNGNAFMLPIKENGTYLI